MVIPSLLILNDKVIINFKSQNSNMSISVKDPTGKVIYTKIDIFSAKIGFTADKSGNYLIWIENKESTQTRIDFEFLKGFDAKDKSAIATKTNFDKADFELSNFEDMMRYYLHELSRKMVHEEHVLSYFDSLSSNMILFSVLIISIIFIVGFVNTMIIQKILINKKLI